MLSATSMSGRQCEITVRELVEQTKFSESAVKGARRKLLEAGLWIAQRGVYVPAPFASAESNQGSDLADKTASMVQTRVHSLYHRKVSSDAAMTAAVNDDGIGDSVS
jgi:hypothetical protein